MTSCRQLSALVKTAAGIIMPPRMRTADQWADDERILPPESPEPGRWRSDRIPFMIPVMRAFSDPRYATVVVVCGAQMGKTESIFNIIGHRFSDGPYVPVLYVGPTEKQVRSVSGDRIAKMLRSTPILWERLEKGQRDKVTEKWIGGVRLGFAWAGSATELASHPAGLVLVDERDRMDSDAGGEGDPVELARARLKNYPGGKLGICSTPTVEGASPIWRLYEEGTMFKWSWPCVHCGEYFIPRLELLQWPEGATAGQAREQAVVVCPHCGGILTTADRHAMNAAGRYIPHVLNSAGEHIPVEEETPNSTASYWISGLSSPWQTFGQLAETFIKAYASREPERIQAVINTAFGELYRQSGEAPAWEEVLALRSDYDQGDLPSGVQLITAGVDVQKNGLYYVVRGWGFNSESWMLDHGYLLGETEFDDVWLMLTRVLQQQFEGGRAINRVFVDSGYRPGADRFRRPEHAVYAYCRRHIGTVFATKGHDTQDRPLKVSTIEVNLAGRATRAGLKLWHIDTDHFKQWLHAQIRMPAGEEPLYHLPQQIDDDYCRQLVAEELVIKPSGKRIWICRGANHYLDCEVLARAAAVSLQVHALQRPAEHPQPRPGMTNAANVARRAFSPPRRGLYDGI